MTEPTGRTGTKLAKSGGKGASSFGTQYVMPIALDILRRDPLMEAEHFPGDLLRVSMSTGNEYWSRHSNERELLRGIALRTMKKLRRNKESRQAGRQLLRDIDEFLIASASWLDSNTLGTASLDAYQSTLDV